MSNIDNFKSFAKSNPNFASYIKDGSMTWQKFYELYDMYGEDSSIWDEYRSTDSAPSTSSKKNSTTLNDVINLAKNIDVDKLQSGVNSLSKAVGLFSDLFASKSSSKVDTYKPRAIYRKFDD